MSKSLSVPLSDSKSLSLLPPTRGCLASASATEGPIPASTSPAAPGSSFSLVLPRDRARVRVRPRRTIPASVFLAVPGSVSVSRFRPGPSPRDIGPARASSLPPPAASVSLPLSHLPPTRPAWRCPWPVQPGSVCPSSCPGPRFNSSFRSGLPGAWPPPVQLRSVCLCPSLCLSVLPSDQGCLVPGHHLCSSGLSVSVSACLSQSLLPSLLRAWRFPSPM